MFVNIDSKILIIIEAGQNESLVHIHFSPATEDNVPLLIFVPKTSGFMYLIWLKY